MLICKQNVTSYYNIKKMSSYSQKEYHHIIDQRPQKQRQKQHLLVQKLVDRNLNAFGIELTEKKKTLYQPSRKERVDLGEGWYCNITDSKHKLKHTVFTLHGAPGDHIEWAGLEKEMGKSCRWVNLTIPGFDGEDERRGSYEGTTQHFALLLIRLFKHLKVSKVILCAHSLGSIYSSYFITRYPQYVQGYINITGIVDHWYSGILTFFQTVITEFGYNSEQWRAKKLFNDDHHRILMHHLFLQQGDGRFFGPVQFPKLSITEFFGYFKLINSMPNGLSELYNLNKRLQILRVLIFGKKDPLHQHPKTEASIYNLCWGDQSYLKLPKYQRLFKAAKGAIEERLRKQFGVEVDGQRIQQYFCYHLHDTGHNAHKRRPIEMSRIMKIYMACLEVIEEYSHLLSSKL